MVLCESAKSKKLGHYPHPPALLVGTVLVAMAGALVGTQPTRSGAVPTEVQLPDYGPLPACSLTDHRGGSFALQDLRGSVWIADFIFTRCAGQCPMITAQMRRLQQALGALGVRCVSFSVDPQYDTPERLAAYAESSGADERSWRFVTGEPETILRLAREGFRLGVSEDGTEQEPITHSVRMVLVDAQGHVRGYYDATDERAVARLIQDARRLVRTLP